MFRFYFFHINNVKISFKQLTVTFEDICIFYMNLMFSVAANRNSVLVYNIHWKTAICNATVPYFHCTAVFAVHIIKYCTFLIYVLKYTRCTVKRVK
jgi:hypothetical protein